MNERHRATKTNDAEDLSRNDGPRLGYADAPPFGRLVRHIDSGKTGKIIWVDGVVFALDNPLLTGHDVWGERWQPC